MNELERRYLIYSEAYKCNPTMRNLDFMTFWFIAATCGIEYARKHF